MFQNLALLLACISSTNAFAPSLNARSKAFATSTYMPHNSNAVQSSLFETALSADVEETNDAEEPVVEEAKEKKTAPVQEDDISCVAYVVNLSYETTFPKIREIFAEHGEVSKVFVPKNRDTGKPKGIAFVTMSSEEERDAAIAALNESEVDERTIYVDKAKPRGEAGKENADLTKLYIGNISYDTTAEGLTEHFSQYGTVSNVYVPLDRYSGEPRGFAFLALENSAAERAIAECDGMELDGRSVEVKVSLPRGTKTNRSSETKLYIGNIAFNTEQETIRELFEDYGPIIDLYVPLDQNTSRPRGFAFVTLEPDNAQRAIEEVDGWEVDGRMLRVNEAQPKGSGRGGEGGSNSDQATNEW